MRTIETRASGEVIDETLVFESEAEREEFFAREEKRITDKQGEALAALNKSYMEQVRHVHEAFAGARGKLQSIRNNSILESDLQQSETF